MIILLVNFLFVVSILGLIFLQTSRSILIRTGGLFLIEGSIILSSTFNQSKEELIFIVIVTSLLGFLGFLSDYYSASLRTWFFYVSRQSIKTTFFGIIFCLILFSFFISGGIALSLLVGTLFGSIIGELREIQGKDFNRIIKSVLGTVIGLYGMATKILIGLVMVEIMYSF